jgi:hypothetical protein
MNDDNFMKRPVAIEYPVKTPTDGSLMIAKQQQVQQEQFFRECAMRAHSFEVGKRDAFWSLFPRCPYNKDYMAGYRTIHPSGMPYPPP